MNGVFVPNLLSFEDNETGLLYGVNRLVGTIRIRTQRVQNRSCVIAAPFRDTIDDCYGRWSFLDNEEGPCRWLRCGWMSGCLPVISAYDVISACMMPACEVCL